MLINIHTLLTYNLVSYCNIFMAIFCLCNFYIWCRRIKVRAIVLCNPKTIEFAALKPKAENQLRFPVNSVIKNAG